MQVQVLGLSVDSVPCLVAWAESLGGITYPLLSDFYPHGAVAQLYGVLRPDGKSERAIFVIDKQGVIRYVDVHDIDEQPDNDVLFAELEKLEPLAAAAIKAAEPISASGAKELERPASGVIMYCTPWCPACKLARAWFRDHGIEYLEVDITRDREAARLVRSYDRGYETTPTFDINGTIIVNYSEEKLKKALGIP